MSGYQACIFTGFCYTLRKDGTRPNEQDLWPCPWVGLDATLTLGVAKPSDKIRSLFLNVCISKEDQAKSMSINILVRQVEVLQSCHVTLNICI